MNDNFKKGIKEKFLKIKSIKNIKVIICIIFIAVILFVYGLIKDARSDDTSSTSEDTIATSKEVSEVDELESILKSIDGAGNVNVFIGYSGVETTVYAYDRVTVTSTREDNSGGGLITTNVEETTTPVMVKVDGVDTPVIEKVLKPEISGVIIVAEGARDIGVRLNLIKATAKALNISEKLIEIFIMD